MTLGFRSLITSALRRVCAPWTSPSPTAAANHCPYSHSNYRARKSLGGGTVAMKDPFPIAPIPALSEWVRPFAEKFNLIVLPQHIHEVIFAALMYTFVHLVISPWLSMKYAPKQYPTHRGKRASWDSHVVSLFQSTLINILALWCMFADEERKTFDWQARIWGYTGASGMIQSLVAGYFVWDFIITICFVDVFGIGVLVHATSALLVYSFGYVSSGLPFALGSTPCADRP